MNHQKPLSLRLLQAAGGLFFFSFGVYLTIQASIGLGPWDVLDMGISAHTPLTYGDAALCVSVLVLALDLLLKEQIGFGTILDALITGKAVDLFDSMKLVPQQTSLWSGVLCMTVGMTVMVVGQRIYMAAGLGCGPRDSLLVGLGKRVRRIPIGAVLFAMLLVVLAVGWLLGGPVGIGTLMSTFGMGWLMQVIFRLMRFEPRDIPQESVLDTLRRSRKRQPEGAAKA